MNRNTHPVEREELMAWVDGEVAAGRATEIAAHVGGCEKCRALAADLRRVSAQMAAWQVEPAPASLGARADEALEQLASSEEKEKSKPDSTQPQWRRLVPAWAWQLSLAGGVLLVIAAISLPNLLVMHKVSIPRPARSQSAASTTQQESRETARFFTLDKSEQGEPNTLQPHGPMVVRTATLTILVKEFDSARASMEALVREYGGYIAQLAASGQESAGRTLSATLRAPADKLDAILAEMKKLGRVENESQSSEEVTQQYVDLVARLKNERNTEQRLVQVLQQRTGKMEDVLEVEREIARVRGEIERMEAQRKTLETQVALASVKLELREDYQARLQMAPPSTTTQLWNAAVEGYQGVVETLLDLTFFVLRNGPTLLLWAALLFWPARFAWRRIRAARTQSVA